MAEIKEKHPSWFKMKIERRELVRQLSPETAVNVLLACWDFLETGEKPTGLSPIENVAFSSFMPDMDEAWSKYIKRVTSGANGGRPKSKKPYGSICPHTAPYGTEEETEEDSILLRNIDRERGGQAAHTPPLCSSNSGTGSGVLSGEREPFRPCAIRGLLHRLRMGSGQGKAN